MTDLRMIVLVVLLGPGAALACSCMQLPEVSRETVIDAYCKAEVVMIGNVESSRQVKGNFFEFRIQPDRNLKGNDESPVFALSAVGGMCGYPFKEGGDYLIFASRRKDTNQLSASIYGWTRPVDKASFLIDVLNEVVKTGQDPCAEEAASKSPDTKAPDTKKRRQKV